MTNSRARLDADLLYEVVSPFMSCSDLHGLHRSLEEVKRCFDQIGQPEDGIAVNPATGKCIHAIAAMAADGTQRKFSDKELDLVDALSLDRRIILEDVPNVTTFSHIAGLFYAGLLTVPQLSVDLAGFFDYKNRNQTLLEYRRRMGAIFGLCAAGPLHPGTVPKSALGNHW